MSKTIVDLRNTLFEAIEGIKNGTLEIDKGKAINELAKTVVDTARTEIEFSKTSGQTVNPEFMGAPAEPKLPDGITGRHVHRLR